MAESEDKREALETATNFKSEAIESDVLEGELEGDKRLFIHGANLEGKENHARKYVDEKSKTYLAEIREKYDTWKAKNLSIETNHPQSQVPTMTR